MALCDRYEYLAETKRHTVVLREYDNAALQTDLNVRGQEGWELVTLAQAASGREVFVQFIWKRKIIETMQLMDWIRNERRRARI